jgi:hypothetical protein
MMTMRVKLLLLEEGDQGGMLDKARLRMTDKVKKVVIGMK